MKKKWEIKIKRIGNKYEWAELLGRLGMNSLIIYLLFKFSFDWLDGDRITFLTSCVIMLMLDRKLK